MTIQQTVTIPADQRLVLDLPMDTPTGEAKLVITPKRPLTQAEFDAGLECPLDHTPNAETIAAMREGDAILRGEIPAALTIDLSGYKTREERKAAMRAAFDAFYEADED
jgi:hypothetical protein